MTLDLNYVKPEKVSVEDATHKMLDNLEIYPGLSCGQ